MPYLLMIRRFVSIYMSMIFDTLLDSWGFLLLSVFLSCFIPSNSYAEIEVNLSVIKQIESSGRPEICSFKGCRFGRGLYQVSEVLLKEWNQFNRVKYSPNDLFDPSVNKEIASWYLWKRIPELLRHYHLPLSLENILIAYNEGIKSVVDHKWEERTHLHPYVVKYQKELLKKKGADYVASRDRGSRLE